MCVLFHVPNASVKASKTLILQNMQACVTISESLMTWVNYEEQWKLKRTASILDPYQMFKESQLFSEQVTPV